MPPFRATAPGRARPYHWSLSEDAAITSAAARAAGMIEDPTFWPDEGCSTLLSRFLPVPGRSKDEVLAGLASRMRRMVGLLPASGSAPASGRIIAQCRDAAFLQIIVRDAHRTFYPKSDPLTAARTAARQEVMCETLRIIHSEIQDYHQGLGFIVAFLHLFLGTPDVVRVVLALHYSNRHSMGYFRAESKAFVRDARVLHRLIKEQRPALAGHLERLGAVPEMYAVKWFVGLCVHVLPWEQLLDFWESYFQHGTVFLLAFGLAFVAEFEHELLAAQSTGGVLSVLRMEDPTADWRFPTVLGSSVEARLRRTIEAALSATRSGRPDPGHVAQMRLEEAVRVKGEVERAQHAMQALAENYDDDEIVFSDEDM